MDVEDEGMDEGLDGTEWIPDECPADGADEDGQPCDDWEGDSPDTAPLHDGTPSCPQADIPCDAPCQLVSRDIPSPAPGHTVGTLAPQHPVVTDTAMDPATQPIMDNTQTPRGKLTLNNTSSPGLFALPRGSTFVSQSTPTSLASLLASIDDESTSSDTRGVASRAIATPCRTNPYASGTPASIATPTPPVRPRPSQSPCLAGNPVLGKSTTATTPPASPTTSGLCALAGGTHPASGDATLPSPTAPPLGTPTLALTCPGAAGAVVPGPVVAPPAPPTHAPAPLLVDPAPASGTRGSPSPVMPLDGAPPTPPVLAKLPPAPHGTPVLAPAAHAAAPAADEAAQGHALYMRYWRSVRSVNCPPEIQQKYQDVKQSVAPSLLGK